MQGNRRNLKTGRVEAAGPYYDSSKGGEEIKTEYLMSC